MDVGQIILVATRHFGEDEIDRGRAKEGQSVKTLNDAKASREPVGREDDLQLSKQMGEIESFGPEFRICALLGLPEIQVLLFGGDPGQRKNGVNVVRGGEFSRTVWITQCKRGPAKERHLRWRSQIAIKCLKNPQGIIHVGTANRSAVARPGH